MQPSVQTTRQGREAYELGLRLFEAGDAEGALAHFDRALAAQPRWADVHYRVGLLHERRDDLDQAAISLERALEINPNYAEAGVALSSVYERQGLYERSRRLAERLQADASPGALDATTRGKLANLQARLGDAHREVGELDEAITAYRKALDRCPGFHDIRRRLGVALREAGLPSQAIAEFRRILRIHPDSLDAAVQLGLTYYTLGRLQDALDEWQRVLDQDPDRRDAAMYLRMLGGKRSPGRGGARSEA